MLFKILRTFLIFCLFYTPVVFAKDTELLCPPANYIQANALKFDKAYAELGYYTVYTSNSAFEYHEKPWQIISLLRNMNSEEAAIKQAQLDAKKVVQGLNVYAERGIRFYSCYYIPGDFRTVTPV